MSPWNEQATKAAPFEKQTPWSLGKQFFAKQEPRPEVRETSTGSVNSRRWRALARSQRRRLNLTFTPSMKSWALNPGRSL
jgi:hypothetical protein